MTPFDRHAPARDTDTAIRTRASIRAFLPDPVPRRLIEEILEVASRAPSGTNTQPWRVWVTAGEVRRELSRRILEIYDDPDKVAREQREFEYYPGKFVEPFLARRRKVGWDMYGLLGIGKGDREKTHVQHGRNFMFFDAPVGLIFTMHRSLEIGSWLDHGMFLQNVMVAARARGLDTCPQAAFTQYHRVIREFLDIPQDELVTCGMSLGYADPDAPINSLVTEREPVGGFARFVGFPAAAG